MTSPRCEQCVQGGLVVYKLPLPDIEDGPINIGVSILTLIRVF